MIVIRKKTILNCLMLFCICSFFCLILPSAFVSYIASSVDLVSITVAPLCSNKFCNFKAIAKFIFASEIPLSEELNNLQNGEYQERLAWGIYNGIMDWFKVVEK